MKNNNKKKKELAHFLKIEPKELIPSGKNSFFYKTKEFLILTNNEADKEAKSFIENNLVYFSEEDIISICNITDKNIIKDINKAINTVYSNECSLSIVDSKIMLKNIINNSLGLDNFIKYMITNNGRGQYITPAYPSETKYNNHFYIYRID